MKNALHPQFEPDLVEQHNARSVQVSWMVVDAMMGKAHCRLGQLFFEACSYQAAAIQPFPI